MVVMLRTYVMLAVLCGAAYPLLITVIAKYFFHHQSTGSIIYHKGHPVGSGLIGQNFTSARFFHGRLSNAGNGYDASNSNGSTLFYRETKADLAKRIAQIKADNDNAALPPGDLITISASGLDPHISIEAAKYQAQRIAKAWQINPKQIEQVIDRLAEPGSWDIWGTRKVNVLLLNLELLRCFAHE